MSSLLKNPCDPPPQHRPDFATRQRQPNPSAPIEISDSDDIDDDVPLATRHRHTLATSRRRLTVTIESSSGSEASATSGISSSMALKTQLDAPSPAHKRLKLDHRFRRDYHVAPLRYPGQEVAPQIPFGQGPPPAATRHQVHPRAQGIAFPTLADGESAQSDASISQPPYYYDVSLECRMYRGPGYEYFPVALGTVDGHQEKCDEWDAITAVAVWRAQDAITPVAPRRAYDVNTAVAARRAQDAMIPSHPEVPDNADVQTDQKVAAILNCVLEVLPEVDHSFAEKKIRAHLAQYTLGGGLILHHRQSASDIVAQILDSDSYPKESPQQSEKGKEKATEDETGVTIVWKKNMDKNAVYLKEAVILLFGQFPHVPTHYIFKVVHEKRSIFDTYIHINDIDNKYFTLPDRPYRRLKNALTTIEKKYAARGAHEKRDLELFSQMVNELQAAKQQIARESLKLERQREKDDAEAANLLAHKKSGDIVECQCCFDDEIPINRVVTCQGDDIHFFCFGCINQLANSQIGLMKHEMLCMDGGGCKAYLSTEGIGQAIPIKTFDRLAFNQQQAEIAAAGIEGLEQCPFCDFKGICGPVEEERVFNCQNPDCFRATCRLCKENAHIPQTCEEAKVDKGLSARHIVEEARTEAMVRTCPKCKVKIIKELGCNKMMCNQCRCIMCYVCKADISNGKEGGYEHFNKAGSKCNLYDKNGHDMHDEEADAAEEEAIRQVKAGDAELDDKQLRIETGKDRKKNVKNYPARRPPVFYPGMALPPLGALLNNPPPARNDLLADNILPLQRAEPGGDPHMLAMQMYQQRLFAAQQQAQQQRLQVAAQQQLLAAQQAAARQRIQIAAQQRAEQQANRAPVPPEGVRLAYPMAAQFPYLPALENPWAPQPQGARIADPRLLQAQYDNDNDNNEVWYGFDEIDQDLIDYLRAPDRPQQMNTPAGAAPQNALNFFNLNRHNEMNH